MKQRSGSDEGCLLLPDFLRRLSDPSIKTVLLAGCGGGFDFVHSLTLYPELRRLGKSVVVGSYSFGNPDNIGGNAETVFAEAGAVVKRVTCQSVPDPYYGPEVHVCTFLDGMYPSSAPHFVYAYNARAFTVPRLQRFYRQVLGSHAIDAVILVDGGSDSLMAGDEEGLGDPIEDAVSVAAVAAIDDLQAKVLISIGLGADRFNHVSDAASLRAIAELTRMGGFLGAIALGPASPGAVFYRECLDHIYGAQSFRSVMAGTIAAAIDGAFGRDALPPLLPDRVAAGDLYVWPLMAMLWAFDVDVVARRSLIAAWIRECATVQECHAALASGRQSLGARLRDVENLPRHEEMRC
jgi:hypothetical protein